MATIQNHIGLAAHESYNFNCLIVIARPERKIGSRNELWLITFRNSCRDNLQYLLCSFRYSTLVLQIFDCLCGGPVGRAVSRTSTHPPFGQIGYTLLLYCPRADLFGDDEEIAPTRSGRRKLAHSSLCAPCTPSIATRAQDCAATLWALMKGAIFVLWFDNFYPPHPT